MKFDVDGVQWKVPCLVPYDLVRLTKGGVPLPSAKDLRNKPDTNAKKKATPKKKADHPVEDYELGIIRCRFALQGKNPAIIKVEVREDRNDMNSKWRQKMQIVIKDEVTAVVAMNVAKTFADCYVNMNRCRTASTTVSAAMLCCNTSPMTGRKAS